MVEGRIAEEQRIALPAPRPLRDPRFLAHRGSPLGVAPAAASTEDTDSISELEGSAL